MRRARPAARDRSRGQRLLRGRRAGRPGADHPRAGPVGDPHPARRRQDPDAAPGRRSPSFARHGTTMAVFLSAARSGQLQAELLDGGYPPDTPVLVAYRATWPDELLVDCTVGTLAETVRARKLWKHTLFLVGPALAASGTRSHLYHPGHFHGHRRAEPQARRELRAADAALPRGRAMTQPGRAEPELTEPDLPRTAKVRPKALRTGWTTGTCASAAAKAATTALRDQAAAADAWRSRCPAAGGSASPSSPARTTPARATAVVVKDAGDDPDVTHGAHLTATVRWRTEPGIVLEGGEGVGVVTKPGLGIDVGEPGHHRHPAGDDHPGGGGGYRPGKPWRPGDPLGARRREDGTQDHQRAPGHPRRDLDPRHDRDRPAVLHRVVAGQRGAGRVGDGRPGRADGGAVHRRADGEGGDGAAAGPGRGVLRRGRRLHRRGAAARPGRGPGPGDLRRAWPASWPSSRRAC